MIYCNARQYSSNAIFIFVTLGVHTFGCELAVADRLQAWRMLTSALTHVDHIFCWRAGVPI
eukprot:975564-Amorphochlora_amoeboformis.AAC.1